MDGLIALALSKSYTDEKFAEASKTDLSAAVVTLSESSYTYDGTSKVPSVTSVTLNGQTLTAGTDYAVVSSPATNAGSYTLTVNGIGDYSGTVTANWTINKAQATISGADSISIVGTGESESEIYTTTGDGALSFSISDSSVATFSSSGGQVTVTGVAAGSATLTVTVADGTNYLGMTKTVSVAVTEASANTVFGVMWDYSLSSPTLTRLTVQTDPLEVVTNCPATEPTACVGTTGGQSDFDNYMPWAGMVRKNYVNGEVVDFTGYDNGETFVFIPEFWSKIVDDAEHSKMYIYISSGELTGFTMHPGSGRYVGRYNCDTNFKSMPSGLPKNNTTITNFRTGVTALDNKHFMYDIHLSCALQLLYLVEWANFNSQDMIGEGITSLQTVQNLGLTDLLSYHTGRVSGNNSESAIQYRWIENLWGNLWTFVDGIGAYNGVTYICKKFPTYYTSYITSNYTQIYTVSMINGYISKLYAYENGFLFPEEANGSDSSFLCDSVSLSESAVVLRNGGAYWANKDAGIFSYCLDRIASNSAAITTGARPILVFGGDS